MNLELKNVKVLKRASEETTCFEAVLRLDGKPLAFVSNSGQGGAHRYNPIPPNSYAQIREVEAWARTLPPYKSECVTLPMDLDLYVDDLLEKWETAKLCKNKVLWRTPEMPKDTYYQQKGALTPEFRAQVLRTHPQAEFLNDQAQAA